MGGRKKYNWVEDRVQGQGPSESRMGRDRGREGLGAGQEADSVDSRVWGFRAEVSQAGCRSTCITPH